MIDATPGELLWTPSPEVVERSNLTAYARRLEAERGLDFGGDYDALWRWSIEDLDGFWATIWEDFDVQASAPYEQVLTRREMPGARWFEGAELNYAENLLAGKSDDRLAIQHASELRELDSLTWGELRERVACAAAALRERGIEPGDRVVAYVPNLPEAVIAFLAAAAVGAIWSSCSPDFGARSVVDRFAQIEPKLLFCVDGYRYNGRDFDRRDVIAGLLAEIPTVEHTVVIPYLDADPDVSGLRGAVGWESFLDSGSGHELTFEQVAFDHPLWVLYSSGTTGLPKAIVQGHGGILLEQLKSHHLHVDAQAGDRVFWFTTTGWMMWNFLVGILLTDASIVLYDGSPGHPDMGVLWDLADDAGRHLLRHLGQLRRRLHEGRGRARGRTRPCRPARRRLHRVAAGARGVRLDLRAPRRRHVAVLHLRRDRRLHRLRRRRPDAAGLRRRAPGPLARGRDRGLGRGRKPGHRRGRRAGDHRADAVDADLLLG